jgi:hypothetical protein
MSIETQLREALSARADEVGGSVGDPYERVSGAITVSRRRRRTAALAAVAAVAAIAVAIPSLGELGRDTTTPAKKTTIVVPGPEDPRWASVATWPTRGSLADDTAFLSSFRDAVASARVLYAGDIGADRVVITWDRDDAGEERIKVYADDRGARAASLDSISSNGQTSSMTLIVRRDPTPDGWMLLLAPPTVKTAEVSPTATIQSDSTVTRSWNTVPLEAGAAVVDMRGAPMSLTRVRIGGYDGGTYLAARSGTMNPDVEGFCGNCTGQDFLDHAVAGTSDGVAFQLGLRADEVRTTTLLVGTVDPATLAVSSVGGDTRPADTGRIYIGLTHLPGGHVVRTVHLGVEEKGGGGGMATTLEASVPLDPTTADRRPFVLHGTTPDGKATRYQVFAPDAASVRLVGDLAGFGKTARKQLVNLTATFQLPESGVSEHRRVETFDAAGALTGTWALDLPNRDDPFDVQP